jgi:6-phosphogluconolactonase
MARTVSPLPGNLRIVDDVPGAFVSTVLDAYRDRKGPRFTLVLSGGPTARACYERLAEDGGDGIEWRFVDILMGDERCVAPDDPEANQRLVREALLERIDDLGSFHPMSCEDGPEAYQRVVERMAALDLVHLGMGPDGHTASLFPGSPALDAPSGVLVMRSADPTEANPYQRMTLTLPAIARARRVVFTVAGESKRDAMARLIRGVDLPAGNVRAEEVVWLVDTAAGML